MALEFEGPCVVKAIDPTKEDKLVVVHGPGSRKCSHGCSRDVPSRIMSPGVGHRVKDVDSHVESGISFSSSHDYLLFALIVVHSCSWIAHWHRHLAMLSKSI